MTAYYSEFDGGNAGPERQQRGGEQRQQPQDGGTGGLADTSSEVQSGWRVQRPGKSLGSGTRASRERPQGLRPIGDSGPTNGLWRDADWLFCRDGKWRPVEPGTFPPAHGAPARVGRLRGYGNAINAEAAVAWIESYLEAIGERPCAGSGEAEEAAAVQR